MSHVAVDIAGSALVPTMQPGALKFMQNWLVNTFAVLVAVILLPGLHYEQPYQLFVASLLLGVLNAAVRPFLIFVALPLLVLTLGFFMIVINAVLLCFVGWMVAGFHVDGFWSAFFGAIIMGVVSLTLNFLTGKRQTRIRLHTGRRPPSNDGGNGPVIDV